MIFMTILPLALPFWCELWYVRAMVCEWPVYGGVVVNLLMMVTVCIRQSL